MGVMSSDLRDGYARHGDRPDHRESVIVTLETGASFVPVDGFEVHHTMRSGTIVSGAATLAAAIATAASDGVVRVERDGEMRALG